MVRAVNVMCPILRPLRDSDLPYKWICAPGRCSAFLHAERYESDEFVPRMLSTIAGVERVVDVGGSGRSRIARRWASYCEMEQASMV